MVVHQPQGTQNLTPDRYAEGSNQGQGADRGSLEAWPWALPEDKKPVPTLQEYFDEVFLPVYIESAIASSTANNYKANFKNHLIPTFGTLRLNEIAHERMEEFVSDLVKRGMAKATIQTIVKELSKFFNHARKRN